MQDYIHEDWDYLLSLGFYVSSGGVKIFVHQDVSVYDASDIVPWPFNGLCSAITQKHNVCERSLPDDKDLEFSVVQFERKVAWRYVHKNS